MHAQYFLEENLLEGTKESKKSSRISNSLPKKPIKYFTKPIIGQTQNVLTVILILMLLLTIL